MVQHDRQDRIAVRAPVRVRRTGEVSAQHLLRDVLPEARAVRRDVNAVRRVGRIADVERIPRPLRLAVDHARSHLRKRKRHGGPTRIGLRDRHVRRDRPIGQAPVLDIHTHPHLAQRNDHRLKARHLRPEVRAVDQTALACQRLGVVHAGMVAHVGRSVVEGGELGRHDLERVGRLVRSAPRCTSHAAELLL